MKTRTVINRIQGWEETISVLRQHLINLERDMESFRNHCLDVEKKEDKKRLGDPVDNAAVISKYDARDADDRRKLMREEAKKPATCKTCPNKVSAAWFTQCSSCISQNITITDHEAAKIILDRVMAGNCQNCGKKENCTCRYVDPDNPLGIVIGFHNA